MHSSFKKIVVNHTDLPLRQIYSSQPRLTHASDAKQGTGVDNIRLGSLEKKLTTLQQNLLTVYHNQLEEGRQQGFQDGYQQGLRQAEEIITQAAEEMRRIRTKGQEASVAYKTQVIELVYTICAKLLLDELKKSEVVFNLIENALTTLSPPLDALIYCHPQKVPELTKHLDDLSLLARGKVEVIGDPLLPLHAMRVESDFTVVELDLLAELKTIAGELKLELHD